jgi:hypothetical protein
MMKRCLSVKAIKMEFPKTHKANLLKMSGILGIVLTAMLAVPCLYAQSQTPEQKEQERQRAEEQQRKDEDQREAEQRRVDEEKEAEQRREEQRKVDQDNEAERRQEEQRNAQRENQVQQPPEQQRPAYTPEPNQATRPTYTPTPSSNNSMPRSYSPPPANPTTVYTPHAPSAASSAKPSASAPTVYTPHAGSSASSTPSSPTTGPTQVNGVTVYTPHSTTAGSSASAGAARENGVTVYTPHAGASVTSKPSNSAVPTRVNGATIYAPRSTTGAVFVRVPVAAQPLFVAQTQMRAAQAGCAQADAYQNYVNGVVNSQNATDQGISQILQTLADNTSDPNLQNALLNSIGQPNPINDTLQQQLQNMASTYENICQTRMSNAQAAVAQAQVQVNAAQGQTANAASATAPSPQASSSASQTPTSASPSSSTAQVVTQQNAPTGTPCAAAGASNVPPPQAPWGAWTTVGNAGLVFDVARVTGTTVTWRFLNAGPSTISAIQFNYIYVDADSGQQTTQSDILLFPLGPGQTFGGWAAYTANTRGGLELSITQISCQ